MALLVMAETGSGRHLMGLAVAAMDMDEGATFRGAALKTSMVNKGSNDAAMSAVHEPRLDR